MEWGRGRSSPSSSGSRRGKRGTSGSSSVDKPRQPQRGLGVAQLERIRLQSEMAEYLHHPPLAGQPPPSSIHGAGSFNLQVIIDRMFMQTYGRSLISFVVLIG
ncbi:hypothetical protein ACQ4PT_043202 [Festuca glaucescens]